MGYGGDIHVCISLSLTTTFSSFLCSFLYLRNPTALDAPIICASLSVSFALCSPVSMTHFKCCLQQIRIRLAISFWLCTSFGVLVEFFSLSVIYWVYDTEPNGGRLWHRIKPTTRRSWSYSLSSNCNFALLDFNLKFYDAASYCCFCISCFVFVFCFLFLCFLCTSVSCLICLLPLMCFACFFERRFIGCACSFCFVRAPLPPFPPPPCLHVLFKLYTYHAASQWALSVGLSNEVVNKSFTRSFFCSLLPLFLSLSFLHTLIKWTMRVSLCLSLILPVIGSKFASMFGERQLNGGLCSPYSFISDRQFSVSA